MRAVEAQGFRAIMVTVDAAVPGKRELDQRAKGEELKVSGWGYLVWAGADGELRICRRRLGRAGAAGWASRMCVVLDCFRCKS